MSFGCLLRIILNEEVVNANDIGEYLRNNEEDEDNEAGFSLHDTPADYLF
jgi:hypothetical protein